MKLKMLLIGISAVTLIYGLPNTRSEANDIITLRIDQATSFVCADPVPWYYTGDGDSLEKYPISGIFGLIFDYDFPFITRIRLKALNIATPTLPSGPFQFPEYPVKIDDGIFSGNGNPCSFWSGPGICYVTGNFGSYGGTFNGGNLSMSGLAPIDFDYSYFFVINAVVTQTPTISVPGLNEWGMVALMIFMGIVTVYYFRNRWMAG